VWQQKSGRAIEAWDCEVYALHAARAKRIHLMSVKQWDALEEKLNQADMFSQPEVISEDVADEPKKKLKRSGRKSNRSKKYE
jgi:phage terminase large subunit GpA-like protein